MNSNRMSIIRLTEAAVITALIFVLQFSGLGYIKIGAASMSVMFIPVTVGAVVMGPKWGALFGGVFGLTSFIECFRGDFLGTLLLGINPVATVAVCFLPRILMGLLCGLIFKAIYNAAKGKAKQTAFVVTGACAPLLNTVLFMATLLLLFYNNDSFMSNSVIAGLAENRGLLGFAVVFVGLNFVFEFVAGLVIGSALSKAVFSVEKKLSL